MKSELPPILLVHGAFHGSWCWRRLVPILADLGVESTAIDLPLTSVEDDERAIRGALADLSQVDEHVTVLAHSYGATPASAAVTPRHVGQIVFLSTLVPQLALYGRPASPEPAAIPFVQVEGDTCRIDPTQARETFYGHCSDEEARWAIQSLRAMPTAPFGQMPSNANWLPIPSAYVVCSDDKVLPKAVQDTQANRAMSSAVIESDHSPFLSHPHELAHVIVSIMTASMAGRKRKAHRVIPRDVRERGR
jgi:pimeloyl-ACP methyl ester carboxylesterase